MKLFNTRRLLLIAGYIVLVLLSSFLNPVVSTDRKIKFPYKAAGLSDRAAAAHLLSRFTFGATPGQIDAVVREGLEKWFDNQLKASFSDDSLNAILSQYDALSLSNSQISDLYPGGGRIIRMAVKDGAITWGSADRQTDKKEYKAILDQYLKANGLKARQELFRQFISQKILRAVYSRNQLQEVMTSFWFNHFNVALVKNDCAEFIPDYERDVIRPGALGNFEDLLINTAKSPAMLFYLDNFSSSGQPDTTKNTITRFQKQKRSQGLNENYARELMELHT
ncbi:MAG: DUF1800 domain-containing protein, partial [Bacteroidota bacterium]|nr:DUF1800 domain-containing protein [Bacteroidota bacterium]